LSGFLDRSVSFAAAGLCLVIEQSARIIASVPASYNVEVAGLHFSSNQKGAPTNRHTKLLMFPKEYRSVAENQTGS
jgi:hypothetical protein